MSEDESATGGPLNAMVLDQLNSSHSAGKSESFLRASMTASNFVWLRVTILGWQTHSL